MPPIWTISAVLLTVVAFFYIVDMWTRPAHTTTDRGGITFVVVFLTLLYWLLATHTLPQ